MMNQKNEINNEAVIKRACTCLKIYCNEKGWKEAKDIKLDITEIYETVIYPEYEINLITDYDLGTYDNQKILGKMLSNEKVILIDKSINFESNDPRFTFTLGHEIGHAVCHIGQDAYFRCTENTIYNKQQQRQEFQANLFAETLIMPPNLVINKYEDYYKSKRPFHYTGAGYYFIGDQHVYIKSLAYLGWKLALPLTGYFSNISKESLAYRMVKIGIIKNETNESIFDRTNSAFNGVNNKLMPKHIFDTL